MPLKPLGNRLIVKPDSPETASAGGIIFPQTYGTPPPMTGTVICVADGPASAHRVRQATIDRCRAIIAAAVDICEDDARAALDERLRTYADEQAKYPEVAEGDYVCFANTAGHTLQIDGDDMIVIDAQDVEAVWQPEQEKESVA